MITMKRLCLYLVSVAAVLGVAAGSSTAENTTVELSAVPFVCERGGGGTVAFQINLPSVIIGRRLDAVLLELRAETSVTPEARSANVPVSVAPCADTEKGAVVMYGRAITRVFPAGVAKGVVFDVTTLVKDWLAGGMMSGRIVIGSLDFEEASVTLRALGEGGAEARLTFFYQNRFGQRAPRN
jgi:hypothetical protein